MRPDNSLASISKKLGSSAAKNAAALALAPVMMGAQQAATGTSMLSQLAPVTLLSGLMQETGLNEFTNAFGRAKELFSKKQPEQKITLKDINDQLQTLNDKVESILRKLSFTPLTQAKANLIANNDNESIEGVISIDDKKVVNEKFDKLISLNEKAVYYLARNDKYMEQFIRAQNNANEVSGLDKPTIENNNVIPFPSFNKNETLSGSKETVEQNGITKDIAEEVLKSVGIVSLLKSISAPLLKITGISAGVRALTKMVAPLSGMISALTPEAIGAAAVTALKNAGPIAAGGAIAADVASSLYQMGKDIGNITNYIEGKTNPENDKAVDNAVQDWQHRKFLENYDSRRDQLQQAKDQQVSIYKNNETPYWKTDKPSYTIPEISNYEDYKKLVPNTPIVVPQPKKELPEYHEGDPDGLYRDGYHMTSNTNKWSPDRKAAAQKLIDDAKNKKSEQKAPVIIDNKTVNNNNVNNSNTNGGRMPIKTAPSGFEYNLMH